MRTEPFKYGQRLPFRILIFQQKTRIIINLIDALFDGLFAAGKLFLEPRQPTRRLNIFHTDYRCIHMDNSASNDEIVLGNFEIKFRVDKLGLLQPDSDAGGGYVKHRPFQPRSVNLADRCRLTYRSPAELAPVLGFSNAKACSF